ncbi:MAG: hypothetical protein IKV61_06915 [Clostridia bacterium]|nr:hypothetical protein [Clostridia bacterium]
MKNYKGLKIAITAIALILVVALAGTLGVLIEAGVIKTEISSFNVMFCVLLLGTGLYLTVYSLILNGGYEFAIGSTLLAIGVVVLLIVLKVFWAITLIVGLTLFALIILGLLLLKSVPLSIERTNEKEGFVPYMERIKQEKENEKAQEGEAPTLKSFKDDN